MLQAPKKDDYIKYLENLQEWGVTNVDSAAPYLQMSFPNLTLLEAREVITYWMSTRNQLLNE